ncbi:MAG TPA: alpha/beta hydrolase-fold protein [Ardenticatenaceae bacterium]|nr:alpha/beta hydrolase-fold protein [Ardenticatenaceae bacterium]
MSNWIDYRDQAGLGAHTVVGNLKVHKAVWSPELRNQRQILVYLPPSYDHGNKRYPVIYMHDGQNLFDQATAYIEEWHVDETMEILSHEGLEAIVVGIPNMGVERIDEYSPFRGMRGRGGRGDVYLAFIADTLRPMINRDFRTLQDREHTGILGSSMGGLISLYAYFRYPAVFGFVGAMSPSLWFAAGAIFSYVRKAPYIPGKLYLDVGTSEGGEPPSNKNVLQTFSRRYASDVQRMYDILVQKGYHPDNSVQYVEEEGAAHHESAWARRLHVALRFFLTEQFASGNGHRS